MFQRKFQPEIKSILIVIGIIIILTLIQMADRPTGLVFAQTGGTAVPPVNLTVPQLTPPAASGQFPNGWLKIVGKSAQTIYLTANNEASAGFNGRWQPALPQAGVYRVEIYLGVSEFREYSLLFGDRLAGLDQLTGSARYQVVYDGGQETITVDMNLRDSGWVSLGEYLFSAGANGGVTLTSETGEPAGTAVLALSAARFTRVGDNLPPTATATRVPASPSPMLTLLPPTAMPTTPSGPVDLLSYGEPQFASGESGGPQIVDVPLFVAGEAAGRMEISYPAELETVQAENIEANILVNDDFADVLKLALTDITTNQELGDRIVGGQFFLTLDAAAFEFDPAFQTQKLTIFQGVPAGVAWNIKPKTGLSGQQDFNIKVILRFTDGIPELSGPPPSFTIHILRPAPPTPTPTLPATATPTTGGRVVDNLIDNTAVLIGACLSFIVGILGVVLAYLNYRRKNIGGDAPAALDSERKVQLHQWLDEYFDEQELRTLSMELGVDYDDLRFSGQSNKARELVGWCARKERLDELTAVIQRHRPNLVE